MRIGTLLFALWSYLLVSVSAAPTVESRDFIGDVINALGLGLVTKINSFLTLDTLTTNLISINFDGTVKNPFILPIKAEPLQVKNPLILELTIDRVVSSAGINGTVYATFDHKFPGGFVVPPLKTNNSGTVDNVLLTQGAMASLDIIPLGVLDLITTDVYLRAATIKGKLGIPIPITGLKQSNVPTTYTFNF
ncbi:uncharacterized protein LACBIDRAFT_297593 [Laccaria bicolor S238N-H82]|uniref:Predicted protein n=1 Tax=Laccaria bicolor (strain S238N-H82 / ATCC MYA-4686) TaxID=486041 RepID=B0DBJ6_LACBS|nr:uncharacterized protein LACBIDRAFT_297593 [Laccaria bicolor S238N-H82]EDR08009.1 predicted protein [Laccaria bicolor S238N-H82]|eukprot:XP_001881079.1 predicted protein [Laccaria bicolor S238N-H82]